MFWDGIVGMALWELVHDFRWILFLFLIPFEVIGLGFVVLLFLALTAPAWRNEYTFAVSEITCCYRAFDLGRTWRYAVRAVSRLELLHDDESDAWRDQAHRLKGDGDYALAFIGEENEQILVIGSLTEGEARWMADTLFHDLPSMFAIR